MTQPTTRRRFLKDSLAAGSAVAAAGMMPLDLRAEETAPARDAASTVVIGIMGTGGRGRALAKAFSARPGCEVAYLCDADSKLMNQSAEEMRNRQTRQPETVGDYRRILDDKGVDALVIAAPDHWHAPATVVGCLAGKHVYVEKPASHNPHEGEVMVRVAAETDRQVQLGTQRRSSPEINEQITKIREGLIGTVRFARGWINSQRPNIGHGQQTTPPEWLDFSAWQGPAPKRPYQDNLIHYNWHWFWHWGTGELGNNGIHALDVCRWGLDVGLPDRVTCGGGRLFFDDDQQTPDTQLATFHFGDKVATWEHRTWHRRGFEDSTFGIQFYGDDGTLLITANSYVHSDMQGKEISSGKVTGGEPEHLENFLAAIRTGTPLHAPIPTGADSTLLCHLGNIAYRTGTTLHFDPQTRQVKDNPEAEKQWSREYAPGWDVMG